mmetsp:Transcript_25433/g.38030  ORF Transcript_25433/g.38030 Transcript_25433/m.38030 type:complete len:87 (+) Transcript_25433:194-454(+)
MGTVKVRLNSPLILPFKNTHTIASIYFHDSMVFKSILFPHLVLCMHYRKYLPNTFTAVAAVIHTQQQQQSTTKKKQPMNLQAPNLV